MGTEPFFIGSVPKGVHSRLWTFLGTERIQLEQVKYRLHVEFCRSRSSFYLGRSNFFGRVNGPVVYTVLRPPNFVFSRMNTVTIFCNRQGYHLLISGKYSRIKPFRVQTNRIDIYMVTVVAPYSTLHISEPAIYLSEHSQK